MCPKSAGSHRLSEIGPTDLSASTQDTTLITSANKKAQKICEKPSNAKDGELEMDCDVRLLGRLKVFCKREFGESIDLERMTADLDYAETVLSTIEDIDEDLGHELAAQLRSSLGMPKH